MSNNSKIEWCDATWNPVIGCSKISEGCKLCWAERMAHRLAHMNPKGKYGEVIREGPEGQHGKWNNDIICDESALDKITPRQKPKMIFVNSMSDLFHKDVNAEFLIRVLNIIGNCKQHTFQILTKRPEQMLKVMNLYYQTTEMVPKKFRTMTPYSNLWPGTSVENQKWLDIRAPYLLQIPAAVRFISIEPMLGMINIDIYLKRYRHSWGGNDGSGTEIWPKLNWVIIGCESNGSHLGRMGEFESWGGWLRAAEDIVDQCKAAGVKVFVKQIPQPNLNCKWRLEKKIENFPKSLQYQEYPNESD